MRCCTDEDSARGERERELDVGSYLARLKLFCLLHLLATYRSNSALVDLNHSLVLLRWLIIGLLHT